MFSICASFLARICLLIQASRISEYLHGAARRLGRFTVSLGLPHLLSQVAWLRKWGCWEPVNRPCPRATATKGKYSESRAIAVVATHSMAAGDFEPSMHLIIGMTSLLVVVRRRRPLVER